MPFHVKPLPKKEDPKTSYNKSLPQPDNGAFRLMITGASGSGKSVLTVRLIQQFRDHFKKIVIFSPNLQQFKDNIKFNRHDKLFDMYSEDAMKHHFEKAMRRRQKVPQLFVFDDEIDLVQNSAYFAKMILIARKELVSIIFTTHRYSFVKPIVRTNITNLILLSSNKMEIQLLSRYLGVNQDDLVQAYFDTPAKEKYNFLYVILNPFGVYFNFSDKKLL